MIRILLVLPLLLLPAMSQARCLFCPDEQVDPTVAHAGLERTLGAPLPAGTEVVFFIEGGFQDLFWQFILRVPDDGVELMLEQLAAEEIRPHTGTYALPDGEGWEPSSLETAQRASITLGTFPHAGTVFGPDPENAGHTLIFVFAHQV